MHRDERERRVAVHIRSRRHAPPVERIPIKSADPAGEIQVLTGLMHGLNVTVQCLWDTVHELRQELDRTRPAAQDVDPLEQRPTTWRTPPAGVSVAEQIAMLQRQVDELNGDATYLWFEAQWLRAQLAVSRGAGRE